MRDLGVDLSARLGVCMYRTISHLPPETLLRNEITQARPDLNLNLNLRVHPACLNPNRLPGHVCTISHLPPETLLRNEITQARPDLNPNLNPRVRPACLNPNRVPGHVCTISHLPPKTLLRNEITQARPACLSPAFGCHKPQLSMKGAAAQ